MVLAIASTESLDFQLLFNLRMESFPSPTSPVSLADFLVSLLVTILPLSFALVFPAVCYFLHVSSLWFPPVTTNAEVPIPPSILAPTAHHKMVKVGKDL